MKQAQGIHLVNELRFTGLYLKHLLLNRSLSDHPEYGDGFLLPNAIRAIDGLILDRFLFIAIKYSSLRFL